MTSRRNTLFALSILLCSGVAFTASAQSAAPATARIRGTVEKLDGKTLTVKTEEGQSASFMLAADAVITANKPSNLGAIKPGDFVASAATRGSDGKLHSTELRIFPEALRGAGEGQRPMDAPNTMMTNATVSEVLAAPSGRVLKVKFKQGTSELIVDPDVKITAVMAADVSVLKPGTAVTVTATKAADGSMTATRVGTN